jgi:hypothetical protein
MAVRSCAARNHNGIGFVLTPEIGISFIDLDHCIGPEHHVEAWAKDVILELDSYTELSPGGDGIHILISATLPPDAKHEKAMGDRAPDDPKGKGKIELYDNKRYLTFTGKRLSGYRENTPLVIERRQHELDRLYAGLFPPLVNNNGNGTRPHVALTDRELIDMAMNARNGAKFSRLWNGDMSDWDNNHSRADLALCCMLAFWTAKDAIRMDALFRQSALNRQKWDRPDYLERTIQAAIERTTETFDARGHERQGPPRSAAPRSWPEPQPIRAELSPVHVLPVPLIAEPLRGWLVDIARRMQCPLEFVVVAGIVVLSSIIGAGCGIRPKRRDDWLVIPNLWGAVIGPPSLMLKSPALAEAMRPLNRLEIEAHREYQELWKSYEAELEMFKAQKDAIKDEMKSAAKGRKRGDRVYDTETAKNDYAQLEEPPFPVCRRFLSNDSTIEKLSEILAGNPRGLLLFRDELIGLFSSWDREGHESDRAFFLEGWNGNGSHKTDRIGRGTIFTKRVCISLLGGIQPAKLCAYLYSAMRGNDNDGLVQRLQLAVYPDVPPQAALVDQYPDNDSKARAWAVIDKLAEADFLQLGATPSEEADGMPYFRFDAKAQELFYEWFDDLSFKLRKEDDEPIVIEHLGKYRSLMPSLALIYHLVDVANGGSSSGPVSLPATEKAVLWCGYLEEHARRIYGLVTNIRLQAAARLAKKIRNRDLLDTFTVREVYRKDWTLLGDREIVQAACEELVALGWLRERQPTGVGGRPKSPEYDVNPRIRQ